MRRFRVTRKGERRFKELEEKYRKTFPRDFLGREGLPGIEGEDYWGLLHVRSDENIDKLLEFAFDDKMKENIRRVMKRLFEAGMIEERE